MRKLRYLWGKRTGSEDPTSLGRLLVDREFISEADLLEALDFMSSRSKNDVDCKIGQALIHLDKVDSSVILKMLRIQDVARKGNKLNAMIDLARDETRHMIKIQEEFRESI